MGVEHRKAVEAIPPGFMHPDERMVLTVLASVTNDSRLEWAHDRGKLLGLLGLRDNAAGRKWLQRRLKALDDAGWITRKSQPRLDAGRYGWGLVRLTFRELGDSMSLDHYLDGGFKATPRAEDSRHPNHVFTDEERAKGYEKGLAGGQVETSGEDKLRPTAGGQVESEPVDGLRPASPDNPDIEPRQSRTLAPSGAAGRLSEGHPSDDDLEDRKRDAIRSLAEHYSMEEGLDDA